MMTKYPRTPHLSYSLGRSQDDLAFTGDFTGQQVIVTEKLDGECTTMYRHHIHARSLDSRHHESRAWVKQLHGSMAHLIPDGLRLCGENVYAQHSIYYAGLTSYFYVFAAFQGRVCLSWADTVEWAQLLGLETAPSLYHGLYENKPVRGCFTGKSAFVGEQEGFVVRVAGAFDEADFGLNVAKFVRAGHVQTDEHWLNREVIPNRLRSD